MNILMLIALIFIAFLVFMCAAIFLSTTFGRALDRQAQDQEAGKKPTALSWLWVLPLLVLFLAGVVFILRDLYLAPEPIEDSELAQLEAERRVALEDLHRVQGELEAMLAELSAQLTQSWEVLQNEQQREEYRRTLVMMARENPASVWALFRNARNPSFRTEVAAALGEALQIDLGAQPGEVLSEEELARIEDRLSSRFTPSN